MNFRPTSRCPVLPLHLPRGEVRKPCPDLSDADIDDAIQFMLDHGCADMSIPSTQFGRRVAVETLIRYERIPHVFQMPPQGSTFEAAQPR